MSQKPRVMPENPPLQAIEPPPTARPARRTARFDHAMLHTVLLAIIAAVMTIIALSQARVIAVPTVLAVLCAVALAPLVRRMERLGASSTLAAAIIVGGLLAGSASTLYTLAPSAEAWNARAPQVLREVERRARQITTELSRSTGMISGEGPAPAPVADTDQPDPDAQEASGDDAVDRLVEGSQRLLTDLAIGAPRLPEATRSSPSRPLRWCSV